MLDKTELLDWIKFYKESMEDMTEYRPRKKCRIVPEENIQGYVTSEYVVYLLDKLVQMTKRGSYSKARIIEGLKEQNWIWYSYNGKAYCVESILREKLLCKKKCSRVDLLKMQARYLEEASYIVIDLLEEE